MAPGSSSRLTPPPRSASHCSQTRVGPPLRAPTPVGPRRRCRPVSPPSRAGSTLSEPGTRSRRRAAVLPRRRRAPSTSPRARPPSWRSPPSRPRASKPAPPSTSTVQVEDAYGNAVSDSGVTVNLTTNPSTTLSGTTSAQTGSNGSVTFNVSIAAANPQYFLLANAASLTQGTSTAIDVTAAGASQLILNPQPGASTAGSAVTGPPTVEVQDSSGNGISGVTVTVTVRLGPAPSPRAPPRASRPTAVAWPSSRTWFSTRPALTL